ILGPARMPAGVPGAAQRDLFRGRYRLLAAVTVIACAVVALCGALRPVDRASPGERTAVVAAIQGNVPHARNLPDLLRATRVTQNHADATRQLAARVQRGA